MAWQEGVYGDAEMVKAHVPLTVPVTVIRPGEMVTDAYGNQYRGRGRKEQVLCFAAHTGGEDVPTGTNPDRVHFDLTVYAPSDAGITTRDVIEWNGYVYQVSEPPGCWDDNPWFSPGLVRVRCERKES